jgi:hypothetical protein
MLFLVQERNEKPLFCVHEDHLVTFLDNDFLQSLKFGVYVGAEFIQKNREKLQGYILDTNNLKVPDKKASAVVRELFAQGLKQYCENNMIGHGHRWDNDPTFLMTPEERIRNMNKSLVSQQSAGDKELAHVTRKEEAKKEFLGEKTDYHKDTPPSPLQ